MKKRIGLLVLLSGSVYADQFAFLFYNDFLREQIGILLMGWL